MDLGDVTAGDRTLLRHAEIIPAFGVGASATEPSRERTPYKNEVTTWRDWSIDSERLQNHIHAPLGARGTSWVYKYGPSLYNTQKTRKEWLCMECWNKNPSKILLVNCQEATTSISRHLSKVHGLYKSGKKKKQGENIMEMLNKPSIANPKQSIPPERFYFRILDWLTTCNIPMRQATSEKFRALFDDVSPLAASYLRTGNDFIPRLVRKTEKCFQKCVAQTLRRARGKINITCDI
jgi:hypothetical protein